jgi:hypothetical protein
MKFTHDFSGTPPNWDREQLFNRIAQVLVVSTRRRVERESIDADGQKLADYSDGYKKLRNKAGVGTKVTLSGVYRKGKVSHFHAV